jgi:hypothetical protein
LVPATTFFENFDSSEHVEASIVINSFANLLKQRSLEILDYVWGSDWFGEIRNEL